MHRGWDVGSVTYSQQHPEVPGSGLQQGHAEIQLKKSTESKFRQFIADSRYRDVTLYRDRLLANYDARSYELVVNFEDLLRFDESLANLVRESPHQYLPLFERACLEIIAQNKVPKPTVDELFPIQVQLKRVGREKAVRNLGSEDVGQLVCVPGIVIHTQRVAVKSIKLCIQCTNCKATRKIICPSGFGSAQLPRVCENANDEKNERPCPMDPFQVLPDKSEYIDTQRVKFQEMPEKVPTGEMPRSIMLSIERSLVSRVKPGNRLSVIGEFCVFKSRTGDKKKSRSLRVPYIRVLGIEDLDESGSGRGVFTPQEEEELQNLARDPDIYNKLTASVAPAIFGHDDVKKAVACLLFGGSRKALPSGARLRGDINVLLLGDPSVAKSQFLKWVEKAAPIAVYTSGKGSSAAGLTASVMRDPGTREFHLEGGAMVLADGGVVCIDEFDKMREQDRVAIHEAMEQQTISIAKAGITTILNSRCSVLAAANPIYGRYDDNKSATENIDFQTTILSRFDLIFILLDKHDEEKDKRLAQHIMELHQGKETETETKQQVEMELLTKYVSFARQRVHPRLSEQGATTLSSAYVNFRKEAGESQRRQGESAIPITVRQLESLVRIAESLARMELSDAVNENHVKEALHLFKVATIKASHTSASNGGRMLHMNAGDPGFIKAVHKAERHVERRLVVGGQASVKSLVDEFVNNGHKEQAVRKALDNMSKRHILEFRYQGKMVFRRR